MNLYNIQELKDDEQPAFVMRSNKQKDGLMKFTIEKIGITTDSGKFFSLHDCNAIILKRIYDECEKISINSLRHLIDAQSFISTQSS